MDACSFRNALIARALAAASMACAFLTGTPAAATGVKAGTLIVNKATATFQLGSASNAIESNTVSMRVDQVVDVVVAKRDTADATVADAATNVARSFTLTNSGNGPQAYVLQATGTLTGNGFVPTVTSLAVDSNGNGVYDPGIDALIASGATSAPIDADTSLTIFVLSSIPPDAPDAKRSDVQLQAVALTGSGPPGTVIPGKGVDGGDAVIGANRATGKALSGFVVSLTNVSLVKAATVLDPYGGSQAMAGALITYKLTATISGSGTAPDVRLTDQVPDGTIFVPNSMTLDTKPLTDAADNDEGTVTSGSLEFKLGDVSTGTVHTAQFQVKVK